MNEEKLKYMINMYYS